MIRVLLADDQALVRAGFRALLDAQNDIEVVGEAADGEEAVRMVRTADPDVVLMDIRMPRLDGLEATRQILADEKIDDVNIVILTTFEVDEYVIEAIRSGARGFLVKDTEPDELIRGVRAAARGEPMLSPGVTRRLMEQVSSKPRPNETTRALATVMFSDIVSSTERAAELGDAEWRALLDRHDAIARDELQRHGGRQVKTTGDGFLAVFDAPAEAIRSASTIRQNIRAIGVEVRMGLHTGEVELRGDDVGGIAVHIAARVSAVAGPGEILVSSTVKDLVVGSRIRFVDQGVRALKGIPEEWRLFSVDEPAR